VLAVTLTKLLAVNVAVDAADPDAWALGFASPSLTRVELHEDDELELIVDSAFAVNPPRDATVALDETRDPLDTILMHEAVADADADETDCRSADPNE
jgi:hypothetical protein